MGIIQSLRVVLDGLLGTAFLFIGRLLPTLQPKVKDLRGKTAIVTGGNSGVGYGLSQYMAEMGAFVVLACRNQQKAQAAKDAILKSCPKANIAIMPLDNASLTSVRAFAKEWKYGQIDFLFHNAGINCCPEGKNFSEDGFEFMYQTNFLASFLLTNLLEQHFSSEARVVLTTSIGSYSGNITNSFNLAKTQEKVETGFHSLPTPFSADDIVRYAQNKLMQAAFARSLQDHFDMDSTNARYAFSFEPGLVRSNIFNAYVPSPWVDPVSWILAKMMPILGVDIEQGAATGAHLATSDNVAVLSNKGRYFDRMKVRTHNVDLFSQQKLDRLWARWSADLDMKWT